MMAVRPVRAPRDRAAGADTTSRGAADDGRPGWPGAGDLPGPARGYRAAQPRRAHVVCRRQEVVRDAVGRRSPQRRVPAPVVCRPAGSAAGTHRPRARTGFPARVRGAAAAGSASGWTVTRTGRRSPSCARTPTGRSRPPGWRLSSTGSAARRGQQPDSWPDSRGGSLSSMTTENGEAGQGQQEADAAEALTARLRRDMVGALELFTVYLGERLGLYRALAADGPAASAELAGRTGTDERYVREWLEHHAASGLLEVDDPAAGPPGRRDPPPGGPPAG